MLNLSTANAIVLLSISGAQYAPFPGSNKGGLYLDDFAKLRVTLKFFSSCESTVTPRMFRQSETFIYLWCMVCGSILIVALPYSVCYRLSPLFLEGHYNHPGIRMSILQSLVSNLRLPDNLQGRSIIIQRSESSTDVSFMLQIL